MYEGSLFSKYGNGSPFVAIGLKGSVSLSSSGTKPDDSLPEQEQSVNREQIRCNNFTTVVDFANEHLDSFLFERYRETLNSLGNVTVLNACPKSILYMMLVSEIWRGFLL